MKRISRAKIVFGGMMFANIVLVLIVLLLLMPKTEIESLTTLTNNTWLYPGIGLFVFGFALSLWIFLSRKPYPAKAGWRHVLIGGQPDKLLGPIFRNKNFQDLFDGLNAIVIDINTKK